jgi:citrate synthase
MILFEKISAQLPAWRERVKTLVKEHGEKVIDQVTIEQVYGGMRDIKSLVSDISYVDPAEGIRLRGYSIPEVLELLPKPKGAEMPYVGGLYYLLLVGEIPTETQALAVEDEWQARSTIPQNILGFLESNVAQTHPMTLLSQAVLGLQPGSHFTRRYHEGMKKEELWMPMLEDSLDLTAKLPVLAAYIYNLKYRRGAASQIDSKLDVGANFARMIGVGDKEYEDVSRLYFILHSDHELGNVSAHVTHLVASSLSDIFFAFSAGLNGLAGPLHGLANQECLGWLLNVHKEFGNVPSKEQLRQFAWDWLRSGRVIPGYGHAVLRVPDPRFTAQFEFAQKHFPGDEILRLAVMVYEIVPQVLKEQGKAKNPSPNVDAISGTLQYHYGVCEFDFFTVLFGVGRALGVTANAVWARALGQPIERPKSLTTAMLEELAKK